MVMVELKIETINSISKTTVYLNLFLKSLMKHK